MKRSIYAVAAISLVVSLFSVNKTLAQGIWTQRTDKIQIKVEYLKPSFANQYPGSNFSSNIFALNARIPIGKSVFALVEASTVSESFSFGGSSSTKSSWGNPLFGIEIGDVTSMIYGELGFRPSGKKDFTGFSGYYSDFERAEAYVPDLTTYYAAVNVGSTARNGFVYQVRVGPTIWSPKNGGDSETIIDYGVKGGYEENGISLYSALTGRWNTKVKGGKSAFHFLGFDLGYRIQMVRPALFFRLPLDKEYSDVVKQTIGVSATVEF
jgi:hypothetical protein